MDEYRNLFEMASELGRVRGWAPGNYLGKCRGCGQGFMGDKRASECLPCAANGLEVRVAELYAALKPFQIFAEAHIDICGWTSNIHREAISYWFGPSEFIAVLKATGTKPPIEEPQGDDPTPEQTPLA
jgi:hypothetical protein